MPVAERVMRAAAPHGHPTAARTMRPTTKLAALALRLPGDGLAGSPGAGIEGPLGLLRSAPPARALSR